MLSRLIFHLRTVVTLAVATIAVVLAGIWGWQAMTKPFPGKADAPVCQNTAVKAGQRVYPAQVVVTVLNASRREGLASRTMSALTDAGFVAGKSGNAPGKTLAKTAEIWTADPTSPAVQLVASWLHKPVVRKRAVDQPGVVVLVGQGFGEVGGGRKFVPATRATTICSPPID